MNDGSRAEQVWDLAACELHCKTHQHEMCTTRTKNNTGLRWLVFLPPRIDRYGIKTLNLVSYLSKY